jgi:hypothetical protein
MLSRGEMRKDEDYFSENFGRYIWGILEITFSPLDKKLARIYGVLCQGVKCGKMRENKPHYCARKGS